MKGFLEFAGQWRPALEESVKRHIDQLCDEVLSDDERMGGTWKEVLRQKLADYACGGKMIRGMLAVYWAQLYGCRRDPDEALLSVGAALELLQMFLLVHDDIMDGDEVRRGMPSMHVQLAQMVRAHVAPHAQGQCMRMGEALGICLGDIVFSHALGVLSKAMPASHVGRAVCVFTGYVSRVGLAQMNDMYWEESADPPMKDAILAMYEGKTGHYTFTLPALMGYLYFLSLEGGSVDEGEMARLSRAGGLMGQLFQICDDVLDIRYPTSVTGKPRGSDFMKKKRTFFQWKFLECATSNGKRAEVDAMYEGNIGAAEVERIHAWAEQWDVYDKVQEECDVLLRDLEVCFDALAINSQAREHMRDFVKHLLECRS